ncbi:uncharacterized protein B0T15DRAFT_128829 [Chaetomium strumarium]|uniref:Uncharacterized protein n=1 Tax=Chaetomium strumarium TaxID=1170767 RepID=A0AAJ0GZM5_9PEZI|nr:hypothetical protein B0T15DRAFT_128829 [Chaetomium strumarium]
MAVRDDRRVSLPTVGSPPRANHGFGLDADGLGSQPRMFKKHKVLPHPRKEDLRRSGPERSGPASDRPLPQNGVPAGASTHGRQRVSQVARGPEPPPTPPAHSRTSSASHPADTVAAVHAGSPSRSGENVGSRPPTTPINQQTPPTPNLTPDRTPPGPAASQVPRRPPITDRNSSKLTTDSAAESFRTAPENPYSSDDDDGRSTVRPALPSANTLRSTVRQVNGEARGKSLPVGLGLGLGLDPSPKDHATTRTVPEFDKFDGEWGRREAGVNGLDEEWNYDLMRNVTIRKQRPGRPTRFRREEIIDNTTVEPTNATKALRSTTLPEIPVRHPARRAVSEKLATQAAPSNSESSSSIDVKRSSVISTRSTASTVVEAVLVDTAPHRQKTLRHVRKHSALRDSSSEISPSSSAVTSVSPAVDGQREGHSASVAKAGEAVRDTARDSHASTATFNSISSRKARREVWKHGGVPVVVIPDRRSSVKSSKSPSLRSTSSRRSQSLSSVPASLPSKSREHVPHFDRPTRRSRAFSESDGSQRGDERTMDFPPVIPARSSSLSAPTSRNASRTGSLTAESLRAHNMLHAQQAHQALQKASRELDKLCNRAQPPTDADVSHGQSGADHSSTTVAVEGMQPAVLVRRATERERDPAAPSDREREEQGGLGVDRDGDPFFGKRLSVQNTPFSVASVETAGTSHAEVSEAMAVNIYPHQSKSVVVVNNLAKPSESASLEQPKPSTPDIPVVKATGVYGGAPATPPQQFSVDDVDSPLRNPRAPPQPPQPPAINFIPATPSGLTPAIEKQKQLGNYYEMTERKPKRSLSLLRQALTRRTTSHYGPSPARPVGLLTRTFSLSRNVRSRDDERPRLKRPSTADDVPADESRLHPWWRPTYADDDESSEGSYDDEDEDPEERTYRYPPIDNRPSAPHRSLSARIKRTFAILPLRDDRYDEYYPATAEDSPDRRTIRRTPSGNLRVMKFRRSMESLTRLPLEDGRPYTSLAQEQQSGHTERPYTRLWRSLSLKARMGRGPGPAPGPSEPGKQGTGFLPTLGDRINFPRRLSERRREKRTQELRRMISGPKEVRDGVGDVIKRNSSRDRDALYVQQQQQEQRRRG